MHTPLSHPLRALAACSFVGLFSLSAQAVVTPLTFSGGIGTAGVDQYQGVAGGGWNTAWAAGFHSGTTGGSATVSSASPLVSGGGDYLDVSYNTTTGGITRVNRQIDLTALDLASPVTISFDFRSKAGVEAANQTILIFASSASATGTGANDSWKIEGNGAGWRVNDNTSNASLGTGYISAGDTWHFSLTIDPVENKYGVSAQNLTTNSEVYSLSGLALRNGADASLAWLNFNVTGGAGQTGLGFSIDNLVVSQIPEPGAAALAFGGLALAGTLGRRRRRERA